MKKILSIFIVFSICVCLLPATAIASAEPVVYEPGDAGGRIREMPATRDLIANMPQDALAMTAAPLATDDCVLDTKYFMILNDYTGYYEFDVFDLYAAGPLAQIWVQQDLSWPEGDPRLTPEVTCEQAEYMLGEFENNIYPTEISFFGVPDFHDGSYSALVDWGYMDPGYFEDPDGKQVVLVSNIRDENYYDPDYRIYIAGFYSPSFEVYFDRNVMSIDAYDWLHRTGPNPPDDDPEHPARPSLYEGIFAHEYQHLLHDDYDGDEETFINEGMSDLAMVLTGYGKSVLGHLEDTATHPENSLVVWEDQGDLEILTDYGMAFLFQYYLMDKFGQTFIQDLFHNQDNGISSVNSSLINMGFPYYNFAKVFHLWSVALLIDSDIPYSGMFGFNDLDFNLDIGTPDAPNPEAFDKPGAPPWGTDYIWVEGNPKHLKRFTFDGVDFSTFPTAWSSDSEVLWSGDGDLIDNFAIFEAVGGGVLSFDTFYSFEDYWDFGFVQVSTDGGHTWTSLANEYTVSDFDPNAHPKIIANLPGLTGEAEDWMTMSFDLSAYAGQDILVAFRYVTDWATTFDGWFIDNVFVDDTLISDGTDASVFKSITEILPIENDFTVTFVGFRDNWYGNPYKIMPVKLNDLTEEGKMELQAILNWADRAAVLITFDAPEGFTSYADYTLSMESTHDMSLAAADAKLTDAVLAGRVVFLPIVKH